MSELIAFDRRRISRQETVAGLDEAGRGAIAGPVMVGCFALPEGLASFPSVLSSVRDSKKLSGSRRGRLFDRMTESSGVRLGLGCGTNREIDRLGINDAAGLAAVRSLAALGLEPDLLFVDRGLDLPEEEVAASVEELTKGDDRSMHVAAASILAKVARDRYMKRVAERFPGYGWNSNVGYGTAEHRQAVRDLGPTSLHRKSFGSADWFAK